MFLSGSRNPQGPDLLPSTMGENSSFQFRYMRAENSGNILLIN